MDSDFSDLRSKALETLSKKGKVNVSQWGNDIKKLIEELSIHQIELEYQNEELERAQAEVQRKSDEYADLFDNAPVGHIILDKDQNIVNTNNTFAKLLLLLKEEIIGVPIQKFISPLFTDTYYHFFKLLQKGEIFAQVDLRMRSHRKSDIYVRIDATSHPQSHFYRLAIIDISIQKKLEDQLRKETEKAIKSETQFRQIVERSSDVFFYQDIVTRRIKYMSPTITSVLGYSQAECLQMSSSDQLSIMLPQYREFSFDLVNNLLESEVSGHDFISTEYEILTKDNTIKWIKASYSLIRNHNGEPDEIIGTLHDITPSKTYQKELIAAREKAEENDKLKSAFLANISHEIRTPLNAIIGFSDIMMNEFEEKNDSDNLSYITIVERNGHRLLELINDIICISKIESKQMAVSISEFDINELMRDSYDVFRLEAEERGLSLRFNNTPAETMINSDKDKVTSCIYNLIKNALKYTAKGYIEFNANVYDDILNFYVTDTGIGIPHEKQKQIFERFSQVNYTSSKDGVGLGLSIVMGLLQLLNGTIEVRSEVGKGSTFSFSIPLVNNN